MTVRTVLPVVLLAAPFVAAPEATLAADVCDGISPATGVQLTTVPVVSTAAGLVRPVLAVSPPGDTERLFIVGQDGQITILKNGTLLSPDFLDIDPLVRSPGDVGHNEQGLLGLAFHPDYETNGFFFVYYTGNDGNNVVARYERDPVDPDRGLVLSRQTVIDLLHPNQSNHNGGMIAFGPDGHLYIGTGDGGGSCDVDDNAQDGASLLGKFLRINVDSLPYTVPADNPFVGDAAFLDEIWAYGVRNPWRWSFDRTTGDLYIGDVGQSQWEEIDYQPASSAGGENYGWPIWEGNHCPHSDCSSLAPCNSINPVAPVAEYANGVAGVRCAVTGGYTYRGCRIPDLAGTYFYGDFCTAFIKTFRIAGGVATAEDDLTAALDPPGPAAIENLASFGEDGRGEIYIIDLSGEIFKVVPVLSTLEVSGPGAALFRPGPGDWVWEDLQATSSHPIAAYQIYRHDGNGSGTFDCVFQGAAPVWPGGDPFDPGEGELFSYLATATNGGGEQTLPGNASDGTPRALSALSCP